MNPYDIIIRPILSEKSNAGIANKVYTFEVAKGVSKAQIKYAVERVFSVKVVKVNTANYLGKVKKRGRNSGRTPSYRKAYVTLSLDSKPIEAFENLA